MAGKTVAVSILLILLLISGFPSKAQSLQGSHNVSIGVGSITQQEWNDVTGDFFSIIPRIFNNGPYIHSRNFSPAITLNYKYQFTNVVAVGISGTFEKLTGDVWQDETPLTMFRRYSYTCAIDAGFTYGNSANFSFYGTAGLGYTHNVIRAGYIANLPANFYGKDHIVIQVTPFGIRYGKKAGVFAEVGYGYKGMFHAGLNYLFK